MRGLRAAIAFLTRLPMRESGAFDRSVVWFPLVGALIGLAVAGAYAALFPWVPSLLGAIVAVTLGIWLTGALHEDGLADTLDAFGSGKTGQEALRIMRDSTLGTFGTTAVVLSVLWRVVALGSLTPIVAVAALVMAHSLARAAAVSLMAAAPPARAEGLGHSVSASSPGQVSAALVSALVLSLLAAGWWAVGALALAGIVVLGVRSLSLARVDGVTGDVLGACEQLVEITTLTLMAAAGWQGWSPWWA